LSASSTAGVLFRPHAAAIIAAGTRSINFVMRIAISVVGGRNIRHHVWHVPFQALSARASVLRSQPSI
jgi:hypothetical protein